MLFCSITCHTFIVLFYFNAVKQLKHATQCSWANLILHNVLALCVSGQSFRNMQDYVNGLKELKMSKCVCSEVSAPGVIRYGIW